MTGMLATDPVRRGLGALLCLAMVWVPMPSRAATDESARYLELIKAQAELIEDLQSRVAALEARGEKETSEPEWLALREEPVRAQTSSLEPRDTIGDLNTQIREGSIAESIRIPGPRDISIRFGGYVKSVAYADSNQEAANEYFLPALLGVLRPDEDGQYRQSSNLSRLAFEADAPLGDNQIRGYLEFDFRDDFTLRHAYLDWNSGKNALRAGQFWSAFMDLGALPEGVSEPTVSGAVLARQTQFRYARALTDNLQWTLSLEDPSSNDLYGEDPVFQRPTVPDLINTLTLRNPDIGHLRVGALLRRLEVSTGFGKDDAVGWGANLSGSLKIGERDRLLGMAIVGDGLGRYLLGITPVAAGSIDLDGQIRTRDNLGGYLGYQHFWNARFRSSVSVGYAEADNFSGQSGDAFSNSTFASVNLLYQINDHITAGLEYTYGQRENNDGSDLNNSRIMFGLQLF